MPTCTVEDWSNIREGMMGSSWCTEAQHLHISANTTIADSVDLRLKHATPWCTVGYAGVVPTNEACLRRILNHIFLMESQWSTTLKFLICCWKFPSIRATIISGYSQHWLFIIGQLMLSLQECVQFLDVKSNVRRQSPLSWEMFESSANKEASHLSRCLHSRHSSQEPILVQTETSVFKRSPKTPIPRHWSQGLNGCMYRNIPMAPHPCGFKLFLCNRLILQYGS